MNKKRELVNTILEKVKAANVKLPESVDFALDAEYTLYCKDSDRYWSRYPDGHCRIDNCCIEQQLACLDEHSLEDILAVGDVPEGIEWGDLWRTWGFMGCFATKPCILDMGDGTPVLRIRHDSYLSWFRGYSFQNSYDAYGNGSNGGSGEGLEAAQRYITFTPQGEDDDVAEEKQWNQENAMFRKALILGYPCMAAGRLKYFHRVLEHHTEVFDEFITQTDAKAMHMDLDPSLTWKAMQERAWTTKLEGPVLTEAVLVREEDKLCMQLRYRASGVELSWSALGQHKSMAIAMPKRPNGITMPFEEWGKNYVYLCWVMLTATLLAMAGVVFSHYCWDPTKDLANTMDDIPAGVFDDEVKVTMPKEVWDRLYEVTKTYC